MFDNIFPVLFPDDIPHCDVKVEGMKPTSAGHYSEIGPYGESETLGLSAEPQDDRIIKDLFVALIR